MGCIYIVYFCVVSIVQIHINMTLSENVSPPTKWEVFIKALKFLSGIYKLYSNYYSKTFI